MRKPMGPIDKLHVSTCLYCLATVGFWIGCIWHPTWFLPAAIIGTLYIVHWVSQGWRPWSPGFK